MGVNDRDFTFDANGEPASVAKKLLVLTWPTQIPQGESDQEYFSVRIPFDIQLLEDDCYVWAKANAGSAPTVELEDDGTDISTPATVSGGAQVKIPGIAAGTRLKAGSELQVKVDTSGASETIDGLVVAIAYRPYPLGEAGVAVT